MKYYKTFDGKDLWDLFSKFDMEPILKQKTLKYIFRAGEKTPDPKEDIEKAVVCFKKFRSIFGIGQGEIFLSWVREILRQNQKMHNYKIFEEELKK